MATWIPPNKRNIVTKTASVSAAGTYVTAETDPMGNVISTTSLYEENKPPSRVIQNDTTYDEQGNVISVTSTLNEVTPPVPTATKPNQNKVKDDNNNSGTVRAPATNPTQITSPQNDTDSSNGQKNSVAGESNINTSYRRENPLSSLSSYTYNLSLYILDPFAVNYFSNNGRLPTSASDGRYYIIAQSGGINSDLEPRALTLDKDGIPGPGKPGYDFFIDDLNLEIIPTASDGSRTATVGTKLDFKVTEPRGFTFLTRLARLTKWMNTQLTSLGISDTKYSPNLYQQHYMIGIRFYGYDENGSPIESTQLNFDRKEIINPDNKYALFERFFSIVISKVSWSLSSSGTTYAFTGVNVPYQTAYSQKRGVISKNLTLEGDTVGSLLGDPTKTNSKSLIDQLNDIQQQLIQKGSNQWADEYKIDWGAENSIFNATEIKNSSVVISNNYSKENAAMSSAKNSQQSNVKTAAQTATININKKEITVPSGISIPMLIDQVIANSKYISDTLIKQNNDAIETTTIDNPTAKQLKWYAISPYTEINKWDNKLNDWSYKITYQIVPFETPFIRSPYVGIKGNYHGPVKKYDYYFTGKNTEVISFNQSYDNAFYVGLKSTTGKDNSTNNKTTTDPAPKKDNDVVEGNPTMNDPGNRGIFVENVRANLYSIADQAKATIRIMGDPDFLMDGIGYKIPKSPTFGKFFSNNMSISPYGGQIFIEISFKVAEDYLDDGLMDVDPTQTVLFYPRELQEKIKNQGYIYKIQKITSSFSKGKFEQELSLYNIPATLLTDATDKKSSSDVASTPSTTLVNRQIQQGSNGGISGGNRISPIARLPEGVGEKGGLTGGTRISSLNPATLTQSSDNKNDADAPINVNSSRNPLNKTPVTKNTNNGPVADDDGKKDRFSSGAGGNFGGGGASGDW